MFFVHFQMPPAKGTKRKSRNKEQSSKKLKENDSIEINKNNIGIFPDEVWLKIFGYLSNSDIKQISVVCKDFDRLSKDSSLIREIKVELRSGFTKSSAKSTCEMIRRSRNLNTLIISKKANEEVINPGGFITFAIKNCPHLRHIICNVRSLFASDTNHALQAILLDFGLDKNISFFDFANPGIEMAMSGLDGLDGLISDDDRYGFK